MSFGIKRTEKKDGNKTMTTMSGEQYVYYKRLKTDGFTFSNNGYTAEALFEKSTNVLGMRTGVGANHQAIGEYFHELGRSEFRKERTLLEKKFGYTLTNNYTKFDNRAAAEMIKAINLAFSTADIFERNYRLITETHGQKTLVSFFTKYFNDAWADHEKILLNRLSQIDLTDCAVTKVAAILKDELPTIVSNALTLMFNAGTENGINASDRARLQSAYTELSNGLNSNSGNAFIRGMIKTYHLDEIMEKLAQSMIESKKKKDVSKQIFETNPKVYRLESGSALEHLSAYIVNFTASNLGAKGTYALQTGDTKIKADVVVGMGIPESIINELFYDNEMLSGKVSRERNTTHAKYVTNFLKEFKDSFLIYTNAKNYTLNEDFENGKNGLPGGFSAGSAINLNSFLGMSQGQGIYGKDFVFCALQTIPGAIGDDKKDEVTTMFARSIASALFDDYAVIGEGNNGSATSIHLLNLNGVYVPMSFYFSQLGDAFLKLAKQEETNIKSLVEVEIKTPSKIYFNYRSGAKYWLAGIQKWRDDGHKDEFPWAVQKMDAMDRIKISYHFLSGIREIFQNLNITF